MLGKNRSVIIMCLLVAVSLIGCGAGGDPEEEGGSKRRVKDGSGKGYISEGNILVEYEACGGGLQSYEESCFCTIYTVRKDKTLQCWLECSDAEVAPEVIEVFTVDLTEETYAQIYEILEKKDILSLDPKSEQDACDGYSYYLRLYDENDAMIGKVGGYMPTNKTLEKLTGLICQDIPQEKYQEIREARRPYIK